MTVVRVVVSCWWQSNGKTHDSDTVSPMKGVGVLGAGMEFPTHRNLH